MTQAVNLANFANSLNSSGQLDPSNFSSVVPVTKGGTNASTAAGAATNLAAEFGKLLYPVGSIYINAAVSTNPSTLLGFGTWTSFGTGRVLVGVDSSDSAFDTLGETGGSKDAIAVSHTHSFSATTNSSGSHSHFINGYTPGGSTANGFYSNSNPASPVYTDTQGAHTHTVSGTTSTSGSSGVNANLQPYITVYMWQRTA